MHRGRLILLLLVATLPGCQGWKVQTVAPAEYIQKERPDRVQLIRTDETKAELYSPQLVGDSIRGLPTEKAIRPITIPLEEVNRVAIRKFSLGRTALLALAIVGGAVLYDQLMKLNEGGF
jgi:hypothetical protein